MTVPNLPELVGRIGAVFPSLSAIEEDFLEDLAGGGSPPNWSEFDFHRATLRGDLLAFLCADKEAAKYIHDHGIRAQKAKIDGPVNLLDSVLRHCVTLRNCEFTDRLILRHAHTHALRFPGCTFNPPTNPYDGRKRH